MKKYLVPQSWQFFVDAAETLSLHDVAQKHGLAPSTVARRLSQLEKVVGGTLFVRGPRGLKLTAFGLKAYSQAAPLVNDLMQPIRVSDDGGDLNLNVWVARELSLQVVLQAVSTFVRRHPAQKAKVLHWPVMVGEKDALMSDGYTVSIREVNEPGTIRRFLAASPQYLNSADEPIVVGDLARHCVLGVGSRPMAVCYKYEVVAQHSVEVTLALPDYDTLLAAVHRGLGIGLVYESEAVRRYFADGSLTRVLPDWFGTSLELQVEGASAQLVNYIEYALKNDALAA